MGNIQFVNLQDVFAQTKATVYEDRFHCRFAAMTNNSHTVPFQPSPGYRIMSKVIADHLASIWKNSKKEQGAPGDNRF